MSRDAFGGDREAVMAEMMVDSPPVETRRRVEGLRKRFSPAKLERLHRDNVVRLDRMMKRAFQQGL